MKNEIRYGYHPGTDRVLHISEVTEANRGLKCACICKDCGIALEAVFCTDKTNYFRHSNHTCSGEKTIHLLIKQIIAENTRIKLPHSWIEYSNVRLEEPLSKRRPDATIEVDGKDIYIEGRVTHAVDDAKRRFYVEGKHRCYEIDMSDKNLWTLPPDELKSIILEEIYNKSLIEWHQWEEDDAVADYREKSSFGWVKTFFYLIGTIFLILLAVMFFKRIKRVFR